MEINVSNYIISNILKQLVFKISPDRIVIKTNLSQ